MNKDVQKALTALKRPNRLMSEEREVVIVYKDDLETLVTWAEERDNDVEVELKAGDKVEILQGTSIISEGEIGTIVSVDNKYFTHFPYAVNAGGPLNSRMARNELRKVEDGID